jgi:AraC-like DNA-binding protein
MTVSARAANHLLDAANNTIGFADMRAATSVRAGTFRYDGPDLITGWHHHDLHQIEYALQGIAHVETADARYLLPPHQAVWIPAGLSHCTTLIGVRSIAVFFDPTMFNGIDGRAHVLAATPLLREMIAHATRWPIERPASDEKADAYFTALALLVREWIDDDVPLCLPTSSDPIISAVMDYTQAHLADATSRTVAAHAGISERTLRRHFAATAGMTWREYLHTSRLLRAIALLAQPRRTVLSVALEVGYDSVSAFTRAFCTFSGETPSAYRQRTQVGR